MRPPAAAESADHDSELAAELLNQGMTLPPRAKAVLRAFTGVLRSLIAVHSRREEAVKRLLDVLKSVDAGVTVVAGYRASRAQEVATEEFLDGAIGRTPIHTPESIRHADAMLDRWFAQAAALAATTRELGELLADEMPDAVKAGIYSAKGAGGKAEAAMLLADQGFHQDDVGVIRAKFRGAVGPPFGPKVRWVRSPKRRYVTLVGSGAVCSSYPPSTCTKGMSSCHTFPMAPTVNSCDGSSSNS